MPPVYHAHATQCSRVGGVCERIARLAKRLLRTSQFREEMSVYPALSHLPIKPHEGVAIPPLSVEVRA
jgi:hypothetical protein